jgi:hypothetical protein
MATKEKEGSKVSHDVRLCRIVQGVEFTVDEQGVLIRALILREALENYFGATASPESWIRAYQQHRDAIDCATADLYRANPHQNMIVLHGDRPEEFALTRVATAAARAGLAEPQREYESLAAKLPLASRCGGI